MSTLKRKAIVERAQQASLRPAPMTRAKQCFVSAFADLGLALCRACPPGCVGCRKSHVRGSPVSQARVWSLTALPAPRLQLNIKLTNGNARLRSQEDE